MNWELVATAVAALLAAIGLYGSIIATIKRFYVLRNGEYIDNYKEVQLYFVDSLTPGMATVVTVNGMLDRSEDNGHDVDSFTEPTPTDFIVHNATSRKKSDLHAMKA